MHEDVTTLEAAGMIVREGNRLSAFGTQYGPK
ncbi:hypothetical protein [Paraburkholderia sp. RL18-085-BIA-A]